jgi:hypothetical protein
MLFLFTSLTVSHRRKDGAAPRDAAASGEDSRSIDSQ